MIKRVRWKDINKIQAYLLEAQEEYIKLLTEELGELSIMASVHGWKSSRYEQGQALRDKIDMLKKAVG